MKILTVLLLTLFMCVMTSYAASVTSEEVIVRENAEAENFDDQDFEDVKFQPVNNEDNKNEVNNSHHECTFGSSRLRPIDSIGRQKKVINGLNKPREIHITDDGRVYITEHGTDLVHIFNQAGTHIGNFSIPKGSPTGVFVKGNTVLVTNHIKEVFIFTATGELIGVKYANEPVGVAMDYDDLMYVSEWGTGRIQVYHRDGSKSHVISGIGQYPRKIQFDNDGILYVPAFYKSTIYSFDKCGNHVHNYTVDGVQHMEGLFIDSAGYIYVGERRSPHGKVHILNKTGEVVKVLDGFDGVSDISIAPDGTMWVVDYWGNEIFHF